MRILNWIFLAVGLAGLAWLIKDVGPSHLEVLLVEVGWWFVVIVGVDLATSVLDAFALQLYLRPSHIGFGRVLVAMLAGQAINQITPGGTLGEATKASLLAGQAPHGRVVSAVLLYNLMSLAISLVVLAVGPLIALELIPMEVGVDRMVRIGCVAMVVAAIGLYWVGRRGVVSTGVAILSHLRIIRLQRASRWRASAREIDDQIRNYRRERPRDFWVAFSVLALAKVVGGLGLWITLHALGTDASVGFVVALVSLGTLVSWITNVVPFGIGTNEGGDFLLFRALETDGHIGIVLGIIQRLRKTVMVVLGLALLALMQARLRRSGPSPIATPARPGAE